MSDDDDDDDDVDENDDDDDEASFISPVCYACIPIHPSISSIYLYSHQESASKSNKEPVVELISNKQFCACLYSINYNITYTQVSDDDDNDKDSFDYDEDSDDDDDDDDCAGGDNCNSSDDHDEYDFTTGSSMVHGGSRPRP